MLVNGESYMGLPLKDEDVREGTLLYGQFSRVAYRIICFDGDDAILRNMRRPHLIEAVNRERVREVFSKIEPVAD